MKSSAVFSKIINWASPFYARGLSFVLLWVYGASAHAQLAFNENDGPFTQIICPMVKWIINLTIPCAMIMLIAVGIEFFRGEEIKGIVKKMLDGIVALTAVLAMIGIISWVAGKFGFMSVCNL